MTAKLPFAGVLQVNANLARLREYWNRMLPRCAREGCGTEHSGWHWLAHDRRGLRLGGVWYCSGQCFDLAMARTILGLRASAAHRSRSTAHRLPLGLLLLSRGLLTNRQLREALEAQRAAGRGRIGDWLQRLGFASEQQVTSALGLQWACPVFPLKGFLDPACVHMVPLPLLRAYRMLPVHYSPATWVLLIAFCDKIDYTVLYLVERMLHCRTTPCVAGPTALRESLTRLEQQARSNEIVFDRVSDASEMARIIRSYVQKLGADDLHIAACGEHVWARLTDRANTSSLIFRAADPYPARPSAETWRSFEPYPAPLPPAKVVHRFADESLVSK